MLSLTINLMLFLAVWMLLGVIGLMMFAIALGVFKENIEYNYPKEYKDITETKTHHMFLVSLVLGPLLILFSIGAIVKNRKIII